MTREVCEHFNPIDLPCAKCQEKRKSEALFLADELEIPLGTVIQSEVCHRAAKELRRLHAELERCKQVCAATSEAWREEAALAEPVQEPVAWSHINGTSDTKWHPPKRKPLTDDEIHDCWQQRHRNKTTERRLITRAIERAHGVK